MFNIWQPSGESNPNSWAELHRDKKVHFVGFVVVVITAYRPKIASLPGLNSHNGGFHLLFRNMLQLRKIFICSKSDISREIKGDGEVESKSASLLRMQLTCRGALVKPGFQNRWTKQRALRNEVAKEHSWMEECAHGHLPLLLNFRKREID